MSKIDDILDDVLIGLYCRMPDHTGLEFDFVSLEDSNNVLRYNLKQQLRKAFEEVIGEATTEQRQRLDNLFGKEEK